MAPPVLNGRDVTFLTFFIAASVSPLEHGGHAKLEVENVASCQISQRITDHLCLKYKNWWYKQYTTDGLILVGYTSSVDH